MKVDQLLITRLLGTIFQDGPFVQDGWTYQFKDIVERLTLELNTITAIYDEMEALKKEQARIDAKHVEETGEIETEMTRLQFECPHFSWHSIDSPTATKLVLCNICGKLMEEEMS